MRVIRWTLLIPAAIAAWYAVFLVGLSSYFFVENRFCPVEDLASGFCGNETLRQALAAIMHVSVAASAVAVGVAATAMAPSHKERTTWATLVIGIVVAGVLGISANAWSLFVAALVGGAIGTSAIVKFLRMQAASHSLKADGADAPRL